MGSLSKFFLALSISCFAEFNTKSSMAQSSTSEIDLTPKYPSICTLTKDSRELHYGEQIKVINENGEEVTVVADLNYTNSLSNLFSTFLTGKSNRAEYLSLWSQDSIILNPKFAPHQPQELYLEVDGEKSLLKFTTNGSAVGHCIYGHTELPFLNSWDESPHAILNFAALKIELSTEAKKSLRLTTKNSKVKLVYRAQVENKLFETKFDIGANTVATWQEIDKNTQITK